MPTKIALVTGAPGIVGPGICRILKKAGWTVVAQTVDEADWKLLENIEECSFPADLLLEADLGDGEACHRLVGEVEEKLGSVSLLVNNAAFNPAPPPSLEEITEEYAMRMLRVNLLAPLFLLQACIPGLKNAGGGLVVNIGSIQSELPVPGQLLYPAAKSALEIFTKIWARDLATHQIRVNGIRLGRVPGMAFLWATLKTLSVEKARRLYRELIPLHLENSRALNASGKITTPEDVGNLVSFLASAPQINGAIVPLDGGLATTKRFVAEETGWSPQTAIREWLHNNADSE